MSKSKTQYSCQHCGYASPKWLGRCPGCEEWNSLVEERAVSATPGSAREVALEMAGIHGQPAISGGGGD